MLYKPEWEKQGIHETKEPETLVYPLPVYDRWMRFKQFVLLRLLNIKSGNSASKPADKKKKIFTFF
jgi:hypothetical protein